MPKRKLYTTRSQPKESIDEVVLFWLFWSRRNILPHAGKGPKSGFPLGCHVSHPANGRI